MTNPLAGRITAVICVSCATFIAVGGLRAIVSVGIVTSFLAVAGTGLPSGLALLPMGFKRMWEIASHGGRLVLYEYLKYFKFYIKYINQYRIKWTHFLKGNIAT